MARPWERLFIAAARLFAWSVVVTPFCVVAVLIAAAVAGNQNPDIVFFLGNLVVQLFATLFVAVVATLVGASIGIGTALLTSELVAVRSARPFVVGVRILSAFPAVVLGWFGAMLVLPALSSASSLAVFGAAAIVVVIAVVPPSFLTTARALTDLPQRIRDNAAAAGASPGRIAAHVTLPALRRPLSGVYAAAFSRAVSEAAAVTAVFLAAASAGYPVALFTLPSSIMAHARSSIIDASIAQSALLVLTLAAVSKTIAARRAGGLQWV